MLAMNIAATGMLAQQLNVEVISNNIANLSTTGFKRQRAEFQDLLYQTTRRPGVDSSDQGTLVPVGVQVGIGVKTAAVYRINEQGSLNQTSNSLDLAIQGLGYFQVDLPDGTTGYTRAGSMQLSATGQMVTADGYVVPGVATVPTDTTAITVNANGQVFATIASSATPTNLGQLQLAVFPNDAGLQQLGNNLVKQTDASGAPQTGNPGSTGIGTIQQGFLETSNVNVVSEITNLISAQRAYEMNSKVVQAANEMSQTITNLR
ncbi:MAG TPA: flagellar basal-body rod protein FlgG [Stellaceae bacterium]|nr:flagellar basal-body rod protein FlgG [Stellaceae bacterium]